jgi:hypothetical protein
MSAEFSSSPRESGRSPSDFGRTGGGASESGFESVSDPPELAVLPHLPWTSPLPKDLDPPDLSGYHNGSEVPDGALGEAGAREPGDGRRVFEDVTESVRSGAMQECAWFAARHLANGALPGAGLFVALAYVAIKAVAAAHSLNDGNGFIVLIPAPVPGTDLVLSVGVRQMSDRFGVRFGVDLMDWIYVEGGPVPDPRPLRRSNPGDWVLEYGWQGILNHSQVLARRARVEPLSQPVRFSQPPEPQSSAIWEALSEERRSVIRSPGNSVLEVPFHGATDN